MESGHRADSDLEERAMVLQARKMGKEFTLMVLRGGGFAGFGTCIVRILLKRCAKFGQGIASDSFPR